MTTSTAQGFPGNGIPLATYRFQFNENFRFPDAEKLVPYLEALGISHLYASPVLQARRGSLHGYDVTNPAHLNSELGTEDDFTRLADRLREHGMGLLLDIVPNHMAACGQNAWWLDVLEHGEESAYADYFDIDWQASGSKFPPSQRGRIVLPILSDYYERLLAGKKIALCFGENGFEIRAEGNALPLSPSTYGAVLEACLETLRSSGGAGEEVIRPIEEILSSLRDPGGAAKARSLKNKLRERYSRNEGIRSAFEGTMRDFNGAEGEPESFRALHELLSEQVYRLAFWRNAAEEVNYRRFFGLNDLVALRVEIPQVFRAVHERILEMVARGSVNGLRIDHIDGLRDPLAYLWQIQQAAACRRQESGAPGIYTVVEKITSGREALPEEWPVAGTTGYDYLNGVNTLFIDPAGSRELEEIYRDFTGIRSSFGETWNVRKKQVMEEIFAADIRRLTWRLGRLATFDRFGCDIPMRELVRGLKEITAALPIYRTYCRELKLSERDRPYLERAFAIVREHTPLSALSQAGYEFLQSVFLLRASYDLPHHREEWLDFLLSWQQFTGAVMGKGLEDTAFFVHHGLISLNEVGTNPLRKEIGFGTAAFHRHNRRTLAEHPFTLNATSTHDSKWSEDVRARINVLSEIPGEWKDRLDQWTRWNQAWKPVVEGRTVPSPNEEVLLYQSMLGIWPASGIRDDIERNELCNRVQQFILKAAREAKTHSSWESPNEAHEDALRRFVCSLFGSRSENPFLGDFSEFAARIAPAGACNSYGQVLLKIASPGVPDFFQGNELWNYRLTDPDNRVRVDFAERARQLGEWQQDTTGSRTANCAEMLANWKDGRLKFYLTCKALNFRRANPSLFLRGDYLALTTTGAQRNSVCAFVRRFEKSWAIVAVPRLTLKMQGDPFPTGESAWGSTAVTIPFGAPANWRNVFTQEDLSISKGRRRKGLAAASLFSSLPFALLYPVG